MRQTHSHGHFGYSTHGQGNGAMAQMDDNWSGRGHQWVGIGYTASSRCTIDWLVGLYGEGSCKHTKKLADSREQRAKGIGRGGRGLAKNQ